VRQRKLDKVEVGVGIIIKGQSVQRVGLHLQAEVRCVLSTEDGKRDQDQVPVTRHPFDKKIHALQSSIMRRVPYLWMSAINRDQTDSILFDAAFCAVSVEYVRVQNSSQ